MSRSNIIVIGASAGGFEGLKKIVQGLPEKLQASIFIVWHMSPDVRGMLPQVLNQKGKMMAAHAVDNEAIVPERIYVAPPDHHLIIQDGFVRITKGPKENRFRPAVDPLFRSAAHTYGPRVIGVILSGALDDGAAGLWAIKQSGGTAIVEDPATAEVPSMPENALKLVKADHILPVEQIGELLGKLNDKPPSVIPSMSREEDQRTIMELKMAIGDKGLGKELFSFGEITPFTCPECHGVLTELKDGDNSRFRCHTGHAFSADSLLAAITEYIEENLWSALRSVHESVFLLNHMGDHFAEVNQPKIAAVFFKKAIDAERRSNLIRQSISDHEQLSFESIEQQSETSETDA